jgi:RND family efflux transporter MFP subunit
MNIRCSEIMVRRTAWLLAACQLSGPLAHAAEEPMSSSVLVTVQAPRYGTLPDLVVAYGTSVAAVTGSQTLSVLVEGQVVQLSVTAGEAVRAGQALLKFRRSPAESSRHDQAVAALSLARSEEATVGRLLGQQLATRDQMAQAAKVASDAQSALTAIEAETGGVTTQVIKAPFDGFVTSLLVAQGERAAPGAALAVVTRDTGLVVTVGIEPSLRKKIRTGESVRLTPVAAAAPEGDVGLFGRVLRSGRQVNPKTRLIDTDIQPQAAQAAALLDGEEFRAEITTGQLDGWVVPRDAVLSDEQGQYVFQVAGSRAVRVKVHGIGGNDQESVVTGPIDPHRVLVTSGNYQLNDGAPVRLK